MQPTSYFGDIDDLFERMNRGFGTNRGGTLGGDFAVDVAHGDDELVVTADVPGFETDDFHVTVDDDLLTIQAETGGQTVDDEDEYVRRERRHRAVRRTIRLPTPVGAEEASASYRNGVLTVRVPTETDVHRIDVE